MHYCLTLGEARGGRLTGRAGSGEEALCAEGHVAAEAVLIEWYLEAVIVAFTPDEGQDVVGAGVAADVEQERRGVEGDGERVRREGADKPCGRGIGASVDGVDGHAVAAANHGDSAAVVAHGVVAYGDPTVGAVVCRTQEGGAGEVGVRHMPPDDVCRHHAAIDGGIHVFDEVDYSQCPLAETRQDEGASRVVVGKIVGKSAPHIAQGYGHPLGDKAVGGEGLQCALAVVGRIVVEIFAKQGVDPQHLTV